MLGTNDGLLRRLLLLAAALGLGLIEARQSARQRELVAAIRPSAVAASAAASDGLTTLLDSAAFRAALAARGLPGLAAQPAVALLERLRAEAAASEVAHNLALWTNESAEDCGPSCTGWSVGNAQGMPRTPVFAQPQLDNLWELGVHGYVDPHDVVGWMNGPCAPLTPLNSDPDPDTF